MLRRGHGPTGLSTGTPQDSGLADYVQLELIGTGTLPRLWRPSIVSATSII